MKRNLLLICLIGVLCFAACTSPPPDSPTPTVEAPTATVITATPTSTPTATVQPTPTDTVMPTSTPTPEENDYVWLDKDGLMIYSRDGNLCMKDGEADPVYLMPYNDCGYNYRLFNDDQTIMLFSWQAYPDWECYPFSHFDDIWRIDRQTGEATYLASTSDLAEMLDVDWPSQVLSFDKMPGSDIYVFNTGEVGPGTTYNRDLHLLDGIGQITSLLEPDTGAMGFEISPDGQHIAYVSGNNKRADPGESDWIGLVDTDGENWRPQIITYDWIYTYSDWHVLTRPVWRSDSEGFWIAIPPPNRQFEDVPNIMTTWYVPVDGDPMQITSFELPLGLMHAATFSPDGRYVAYVGGAVGNLHIMRPDGSGDFVYFEGDVIDFIHWEDNTHFVFRTWNSKSHETKFYRGGFGEVPVLIETRPDKDTIPVPAEGCAP